VVDKNRATASGISTINITPAIADEEAFAQVDLIGCGRVQEHTRFRFSAIARLAVSGTGVKTNFDCVERRNSGAEPGVHGIDGLAGLSSTAHIRLVRHDNEKKTGLLELRAGIDDFRIKLELLYPHWREGASIANHWPIEHAVPIQEDGALSYFVLSHFVCAVLSAG
jgi:hypothetical protein